MNPFAGELIYITLDISPVANQPAQSLRIPWWKNTSLWQESEADWLRRYQTSKTNTLPLQFGGQTLYAPQTRPGVYQLRWTLLVPEPNEDQPLTLGPVILGTSRSNNIMLEVRRPPPMLAASGTWNLGLGTYQVKAHWMPDTVPLGSEATLSLEVSGSGMLASIAPPVLSTMPGWEASKVLLESAGSTLTASSRTFRFRVRPRRLQLSLPPISMSYFDPVREVMVSERVTIPELKVTGAADLKMMPGHTVLDARRHLADAQDSDLMIQEHVRLPGWMTLVVSILPWIPLSWAAFLVGHLALQRLAPDWLEKQQRRELLRRFCLLLQADPRSPEEERALLQSFLRAWGDSDKATMKEQAVQLHATLDRWQFGAPPLADATHYRQQLQACLADWRQRL